MPVSADQLTRIGKDTLDNYMKGNPIDQVGTDRPLLAKLMSRKKSYAGAKQYLVEKLRKSYDSNFTWYYGSAAVTYKRKDTRENAQYTRGSAHDGYYFDEDELADNGIILTDDTKGAVMTGAEKIQIGNMFDESNETLRLGFEEKFDYNLHQDGTQDADAVAGIDHLISTTPTVGVVGGINRATVGNEYWRNNSVAALAAATIIDSMETQWRACSRNGGQPDFILAGSDFMDTLRTAAKSDIARQITTDDGSTSFDPAITSLKFHGVPITWDPVFYDLDQNLAPAIAWEKRAYFINTKYIKLRPIQGHDMISRNPPRSHERYVHYWALTWKGAVTQGRSNCHSVLSIA